MKQKILDLSFQKI